MKFQVSEKDFQELARLVDDGYVRMSSHPHLPLTIYNYTQKTQFENYWTRITRQTRGLVLDYTRRVVILCPKKFFNYNDPLAEHINTDSMLITVKNDGYYISIKKDDTWGLIITSRGSFANKYVDAVQQFLTPDIVEKLIPNYTYFCELCQNFPGDEAIILTKHPQPKLICWGIRNQDFQEVILDDTCPLPITQRLSPSEATEYLNQKVEGVVVQDTTTGERVKMKTEYFITHHRLLSNCTKHFAWQLLSEGKRLEDQDIPDEFMPQMQSWTQELQDQFRMLNSLVESDYQLTKNLSDKELGLLNYYQNDKPLIFLLRKNKIPEYTSMLWRRLEPKNMV